MDAGNDDARDASPPWAELPADALSEVAAHLGESGDFVRFHAVCRPWRRAPPPPPPHAPRFFLPCLIQQSFPPRCQSLLRLHSPFSVGKLPRARTISNLTALAGKAIECPDASSGRVLAIDPDNLAVPVLINPLTGDAASLPALPQIMRPATFAFGGRRSSPTATISNGIVMLNTNVTTFAVVLHRPGETDDWEQVDVTTCLEKMRFYYTPELDEHTRRALTLNLVLLGSTSAVAKFPYPVTRRYVVESHGELLCLDVVLRNTQFEFGFYRRTANVAISVTVRALEVNLQDGRPRWVEREHRRGLEHVCFFLNGESGSGFTIDAREFTGGEVVGGCAYFVGEHMKETIEGMIKREQYMKETKDGRINNRGYAVYRYRFQDATATVVHVLPDGFGDPHGFVGTRFMWYMPRPKISAVRSRHER